MIYFKDENDNIYAYEDGYFTSNIIDGIETSPEIPDGHVGLTEEEAFAQVAINTAPPPLTPLQIRNAALADITYTRPSDGVQIQVRHPDYASDYILMTGAIGKLEPLGTRGWISKDNLPILVTREDLEAAVAHGDSELDNIYTTFIATL